jgi:DNA-binding winged helix-turn-helix (wHTH) protein
MAATLHFLEFVLDPTNEQLRRGSSTLPLRPKTFAVLRHLAERPGRLVTRNELLDAVWTDTAVSESVLSGCIREHPRRPRVIVAPGRTRRRRRRRAER